METIEFVVMKMYEYPSENPVSAIGRRTGNRFEATLIGIYENARTADEADEEAIKLLTEQPKLFDDPIALAAMANACVGPTAQWAQPENYREATTGARYLCTDRDDILGYNSGYVHRPGYHLVPRTYRQYIKWLYFNAETEKYDIGEEPRIKELKEKPKKRTGRKVTLTVHQAWKNKGWKPEGTKDEQKKAPIH